MAPLILAHDLGTTGNKASLFNAEGKLLAGAFVPYATAYPQPGWAEQDPADYWRAVCVSTGQLLGQAGAWSARDIAVISFSGEMMGCLPIDGAGRPLRTAIIWADQRAEVEAAALVERVGRERVYALTGHRASSNYTAAKMLWLRTHQPELWAETRTVLQAKDYVAFRLTGKTATDYSDASGTNLFDLGRRRWSVEILQALELDESLLPPAVPSATVIGEVTREAAEATGLAAGTPVVIGGGDGACATVGAGVVNPADAYNYIGSSSWISFVSRTSLVDAAQRTFTFAHLDPDYVFPTGTMQCAGGSYDWLERLLRGEAEGRLLTQLDALAAGVEPGARGLFFLPYLIGERSPHWNPNARGAFVGLSMAHGRAEMARAALEGVAFNLRIILDAFREQGAPIQALRLIGGGARSAVWRQILADVFNLPILRPTLLAEATSLGAAVAGGVGVGIYPDYGVAARLVQVSQGEQPNAVAATRYDALYEVFQEAYAQLAPVYVRIATLEAPSEG
ncbi:MAG: xylulokinase [Anaerolineae bacterium]